MENLETPMKTGRVCKYTLYAIGYIANEHTLSGSFRRFTLKIVNFLTWMTVGGHLEELAVKME